MEKYIKRLLKEIHDKETRDFARNHVRHIEFDDEKIEVTVLVDKQYAIHTLLGTHTTAPFCNALRKCFGQDVSIQIRLYSPHQSHEREMLIPHMIHY